ncbi:MAG TPA: L,D-transpeptidase family protein [Steroidobacteraceae bacterium]|nr:L,D-transpeptidase family protein [Steroidobacteraceae bacterium]
MEHIVMQKLPHHGCRGAGAAALIAVLGFASATVAQATVYALTSPEATVVGEDQTVETVYTDTLYDLARKLSLGSEELIRVNPGVDPWLPGAGKKLVVPGRHILPPGPHEGIVVNLPEHRLYYFPKPKRGGPIEVITYPVSIGKMDWSTPLGLTRVIAKQKDPTWFPPESVRKEHAEAGDPLPAKVLPGPANPLGAYAMRLAAGNGTYLIHGTNNPIAVGLAVTHGCIRMYPDDVAALFPLIPVGTPVHLINEPVKEAWVNGELLLEAHPPVDTQGQSFEPNVDQFAELLRTHVGETTVAINWDYAREVLQKADGVIATVALEADDPNAPAPASMPASEPAPASGPAQAPAAEPAPTAPAVPSDGRAGGAAKASGTGQ